MRKHKVGDVVKLRKDLIEDERYGKHDICWQPELNDNEKMEYVKILGEHNYDGYYVKFVDSDGKDIDNRGKLSYLYIDEFFEDEPIKENDTITVMPKGEGLTVYSSENTISSIAFPKTFTFTLTESEKELLSKIINNVSILDYDDWLLDGDATNLGECHAVLQDLVSLYNKISSK